MTEWELWACAAEMRRQHGDDALVRAAERISALDTAGDVNGHWAWMQIMLYINKLGRARATGDGVN